MPVTYVLFSYFAFLPSFVTLGVGHFGSEAGHIIEAILGIPLHPALLSSIAKLLVLVFPLTRGPSKKKRERFDCHFNPTPGITGPFICNLDLTR